jgi:hypothetical protein
VCGVVLDQSVIIIIIIPHRVSPEPPPLRATQVAAAPHRAEPLLPSFPFLPLPEGLAGMPTRALRMAAAGHFRPAALSLGWRRGATRPPAMATAADRGSRSGVPKFGSGLPRAGSTAGRAMGAGCGGFRGSDDGRWRATFDVSLPGGGAAPWGRGTTPCAAPWWGSGHRLCRAR